MNKRGTTLLELTVVMAVASVLGFLLYQAFEPTRRSFERSQTTAALQADASTLHGILQRYASRAQGLVFNQFGTVSPGYSIFKKGVIVVSADLRRCSNYNVANSASNISRIEIACCSAGLSMSVNTPRWGRLRADSACETQNGLSIVTESPSGARKETCYPGYFEMNVFTQGTNQRRGTLIYGIELFANANSNRTADLDQLRGVNSIRWTTSITAGDSPSNLAFVCQ